MFQASGQNICQYINTIGSFQMIYVLIPRIEQNVRNFKTTFLNLSRVSIKGNIVLISLDRQSAWFDRIGQIKNVKKI